MKKLQLVILMFCSFLLTTTYADQDAYSIYNAKDGRVFRLNHQSGDVHLVTEDGLLRLTEGKTKLIVGQYYKLEEKQGESNFLKYLGNGEFEKSKYAKPKKGQDRNH